MEILIVERRTAYAKLTLNRPDVKNALNTELLGKIAEALEVLAKDKSCRIVLITGANGNFAAGAEIREIATKNRAEGNADPRKAFWSSIRSFPKPLIAAVDGFALGGGLELALLADVLVLGATAKLGLPETNLGIIPGAGGGQRLLARIGQARATRMVLMGEIIAASTAHDWGLAGWLAEGDATPKAEELAEKMSLRAPLALQAAKAALILGEEKALALAEEREAFEALLDSQDKREGIRAFLEKRRPEFKGE